MTALGTSSRFNLTIDHDSIAMQKSGPITPDSNVTIRGSTESNTMLSRCFAFTLVAVLVQAGADCLLSQSNHSYARLQFVSAQENASQQTRKVPANLSGRVQDPRPKKDVPGITQRFYDEMTKFNRIMSPEEEEGGDLSVDSLAEDTRDLTKAQAILDVLLSSDWLNDNERAQVYQSYAWLAQDLERPKLAIEHLSKTLDFRNSIRYPQEERALDGLSRLHYLIKDYQNALKYALQFVGSCAVTDRKSVLVHCINLSQSGRLGKFKNLDRKSKR